MKRSAPTRPFEAHSTRRLLSGFWRRSVRTQRPAAHGALAWQCDTMRTHAIARLEQSASKAITGRSWHYVRDDWPLGW